jgi:OmpA-OmpF porin, OOP family
MATAVAAITQARRNRSLIASGQRRRRGRAEHGLVVAGGHESEGTMSSRPLAHIHRTLTCFAHLHPARWHLARLSAASLLAAALLLAAPAASAQGYFGMGIGGANVNANCTGSTSCDKSSTGGKIYAGYRVLPNLGVELSYFDFGSAKASGPAALSGSVKARAVSAGVSYMDEFAPRWLGGARLGVARTKADVSGNFGLFTSADSKSATQPLMGVALGYAVSRNLTVDMALDFTRIKIGADHANVRLLSVGLTYGF